MLAVVSTGVQPKTTESTHIECGGFDLSPLSTIRWYMVLVYMVYHIYWISYGIGYNSTYKKAKPLHDR